LIRTQPDVHNKGFLIDDKTVVVSSQNFSPDGIELNRDAGLILEGADIAAYFGGAFNSDWSATKPMSVHTKTSTKAQPKTAKKAAVPTKAKRKPKKKAVKRPRKAT